MYECRAVREAVANPHACRVVVAEWGQALLNGPGVIVLRGAFGDTSAIDAASAIFRDIIRMGVQITAHELVKPCFPQRPSGRWGHLDGLKSSRGLGFHSMSSQVAAVSVFIPLSL